ncbi:hypothetical protein HAZT_HAZT008736 [Hyalella azteca]|uniref:CDGSH iron-sulfur domain-containing protein 2 homologue n=1 Tax=Hyalella azteca TaxID=294128 RepID=A0A6A0GPG9_HYAAZ|nr:hypothetical protein HAZT_HAZT008736 [Hyalella azteca]
MTTSSLDIVTMIIDNFIDVAMFSRRAVDGFAAIWSGLCCHWLLCKNFPGQKDRCQSNCVRLQINTCGAQVNPCIRKNEAKVVNTVDIEEIGNQKAFCRCWRSEKFPYCDGSHNKHNETTGDNVGPLLVKKS